MRTTVDVPDYLLVEAKKLAAEQRMPLRRLFEESLRKYLAERRNRSYEPPGRLPILSDPAPLRGVDLNDVSRLLEIE